jgi:hypothetical protein
LIVERTTNEYEPAGISPLHKSTKNPLLSAVVERDVAAAQSPAALKPENFSASSQPERMISIWAPGSVRPTMRNG